MIVGGMVGARRSATLALCLCNHRAIDDLGLFLKRQPAKAFIFREAIDTELDRVLSRSWAESFPAPVVADIVETDV